MIDGNLQQELAYFKKHQDELVERYEGKFLIIKDQKVEGAYDSEIDAYTDGKAKFELGTFLIQECLPGENTYTQTFHSRAIFS